MFKLVFVRLSSNQSGELAEIKRILISYISRLHQSGELARIEQIFLSKIAGGSFQTNIDVVFHFFYKSLSSNHIGKLEGIKQNFFSNIVGLCNGISNLFS